MDFINGLKTFLFNHRKKFLISSIVVGGAVAAFNYVRYHEHERQKHKINEFLGNIRRQRHFEVIHSTCDQTALSLAKRLEERLVRLLNVDQIVADLKNHPADSMQLWEKLKVSTFTEICVTVYAYTILVFVLRIQFAVLGGYAYKSLNNNDEQLDRNLQERYLSLSNEFIETGLKDLCAYVTNKVTNIVSGLDLKKKLFIQNLQDIFWSIQTSIAYDEFVERMPAYLRIQSQMRSTSDPVLLQMYEETEDILSSKELVSNCVNSLLNCGFMYVTEDLARTNHLNKEALPTAKIIPVLHHMIKSKIDDPDANTWLKNLMTSEKLITLSANIYESYC